MSSFGKTFLETVVAPWQKACAESEFPWMATPELRADWLQKFEDADKAVALSCAIGLARCANPSPEEFVAVNRFFADPPSDIASDLVILDLLLTGASPPLVLMESFFFPAMKECPLPNPLVWPLFGVYLRHPFNAELAGTLVETPEIPPVLSYNAFANSIRPFPERAFEDAAVWFNALKIFHPLTPKPEVGNVKGALNQFAFFMRCDFEKAEFHQLCRDVFLEDPFFFAQLNHPCATQGKRPDFDPKNPSRDALRFFSEDNSVCALYRFYNSLLNYPWLAEDVVNTDEDGVFMGLLLLGNVPLQIEKHRVVDKAALHPLLQKHPVWLLNQFLAFLDRIPDDKREEAMKVMEAQFQEQVQQIQSKKEDEKP